MKVSINFIPFKMLLYNLFWKEYVIRNWNFKQYMNKYLNISNIWFFFLKNWDIIMKGSP